MRRALLALATLASAVSLCACGNGPCEKLGERLCNCAPAGITKDSCVQGVKTEVGNLHPNGSQEDACNKALDTCYARSNPDGQEIGFCDWISGRCGKSSCGISEETYTDLSGYKTDANGSPVLDENGKRVPITPDPNNPTQALCLP